jgi:predicted permease
MGKLWQDVRYGARMMAKNKALTVIAVLTIALGIGANTAIFSVVNGMLLRPLPVKDPGQLVSLTQQQELNPAYSYFSYPALMDYRQQTSAFSDMLAYHLIFSGISADGKANHAMVSYVTANYFTMLGVKAAMGRTILPGDGEKDNASPVIVLGYSFWQKRFGGDTEVIGKSVLVDGHPVTVIGVTPPEFHGVFSLVDMEGYLPLGLERRTDSAGDMMTNRKRHNLRTLGRLKPGVSMVQAQASLDVVAQRLAQQYPDSDKGMKVRAYPERLARPEPDPTNSMTTVATLFLLLAAMVLLVACVNVANILLVRASARTREMAVRAALGAGRKRLITQLLTESVLLALLGGIGGVLLGLWGSSSIASLRNYVDFPVLVDFSLDWRVMAYSFLVALMTGVVVGVVPALRASRADISAILHEGGRSNSASGTRAWFRNLLVVAQLAGSLILLIVAGLFVRSLQQTQHLDMGFDPDHILNASMDPNEVGYDQTRAKEFYRALESRVRALPGVSSASLAFSVPLGLAHEVAQVGIAGKPTPAGQQPPEMVYNSVDPPYFETLRIPIVRGRAFTDADDETSPRVAMINEAFAKRYWPNDDPIGKRFSILNKPGDPMEVIGVTKDGRYTDATERPDPYFFLPLAQHFDSFRTLQVRTLVPPEQLIADVRQQIQALDPNLPIMDVRTMRDALNGLNGYFVYRLGAGLAALLGFLGLILAVVGVYGVVSFAASQRTNEIGIRMAMGAQRRDILGMVLRQGIWLVGIGLLVGLAAAAGLTRAIANMLVGVSPNDPLTFSGVAVLLAGVVLTACYVPARRATRVDPLVALRYE